MQSKSLTIPDLPDVLVLKQLLVGECYGDIYLVNKRTKWPLKAIHALARKHPAICSLVTNPPAYRGLIGVTISQSAVKETSLFLGVSREQAERYEKLAMFGASNFKSSLPVHHAANQRTVVVILEEQERIMGRIKALEEQLDAGDSGDEDNDSKGVNMELRRSRVTEINKLYTIWNNLFRELNSAAKFTQESWVKMRSFDKIMQGAGKEPRFGSSKPKPGFSQSEPVGGMTALPENVEQ